DASDETLRVAQISDALALWRGPALGEIADLAFAKPTIASFEELRLDALEAQMEHALANGPHRYVVTSPESLVAENPLRRRLTAQLVLELCRSGRQGDALRAYERVRSRLADELGIVPSAELQALERAVLDQSPTLEAVPAPPPVTDPAAELAAAL